MITVEISSTNMTLAVRLAKLDDCLDVFHWRNDSDSRKMSFQQSAISLEVHQAWFSAVLSNPGKRLIIAEDSHQKIGVVRFEYLEPSFALVSINLNPACRGQGLASKVLQKSETLLFNGVTHLRAEIKAENTSSKKAFSRAGYSFEAYRGDDEVYSKMLNQVITTHIPVEQKNETDN